MTDAAIAMEGRDYRRGGEAMTARPSPKGEGMPDTHPSSGGLPCDHCGKPRGQHSGAIPNCMMYPTYKNTLHATIERLSAELEALTHDFDRLADRENFYVNESERFREALIDWRNSWLCPASDFEACVPRLLKITDAALSDTKAG